VFQWTCPLVIGIGIRTVYIGVVNIVYQCRASILENTTLCEALRLNGDLYRVPDVTKSLWVFGLLSTLTTSSRDPVVSSSEYNELEPVERNFRLILLSY